MMMILVYWMNRVIGRKVKGVYFVDFFLLLGAISCDRGGTCLAELNPGASVMVWRIVGIVGCMPPYAS